MLLLDGCESLEELLRHIGKMMSLRYFIATTQENTLLMSHKKRGAGGREEMLVQVSSHFVYWKM